MLELLKRVLVLGIWHIDTSKYLDFEFDIWLSGFWYIALGIWIDMLSPFRLFLLDLDCWACFEIVSFRLFGLELLKLLDWYRIFWKVSLRRMACTS